MSEKTIRIGETETDVSISEKGDTLEVTIDGHIESLRVVPLDDHHVEITLRGKRLVVPFCSDGSTIHFSLEGETWQAEVTDKQRIKRPRHREHSMSASMPGTVLKIFVEQGAVVKKGEPLIVLEAMKMEHQITSPYDGRIAAVRCTVGELVQPGVDLIEVEPENEP